MSKEVQGNIDLRQIKSDARQGDANTLLTWEGDSSPTTGSLVKIGATGGADELPLSGIATEYVDGTGAFSTPTGGTGTVTHTGGALTADLPVFGAGSADVKVGTKSGNTDEVATSTGTKTTGHLATWDANGNLVDGGSVATVGSAVTIWPAFVVPADPATSWTFVGGGTSTATLKSNRMVVDIPDDSTNFLRILYLNAALPSTPYTVEAGVVSNVTWGPYAGGSTTGWGVGVGDGSTKAVTADRVIMTARSSAVRGIEWTSTNSGSDIASIQGMPSVALAFCRVTDDGTTRKWWHSNDGLDWMLIGSEPHTQFITGSNAVLVFYNLSGQGIRVNFSIYHFQVVGSILPQFAA